MKIKFELHMEKAAKAAVAIATSYGLCRVSELTGHFPLAAVNSIALIIIIAILYGPCPVLKRSTSAST
jgi:hypothetical protein